MSDVAWRGSVICRYVHTEHAANRISVWCSRPCRHLETSSRYSDEKQQIRSSDATSPIFI